MREDSGTAPPGNVKSNFRSNQSGTEFNACRELRSPIVWKAFDYPESPFRLSVPKYCTPRPPVDVAARLRCRAVSPRFERCANRAGLRISARHSPNGNRMAGRGCLAGSFQQREFRFAQKTAIGFKGDPVPPCTANGAAEKRNSHLPRRFAVSANCSRSQLSNSGVPREISIRK